MQNFDGLPLVSHISELLTLFQHRLTFIGMLHAVNTGQPYFQIIGDHTTGTGNSMWIDASSNITGNAMVSPEIDFSGLSNAYVGFYFASNNTTNSTNHTINLSAGCS